MLCVVSIMSRVGKRPIVVPKGVKVQLKDGLVCIEGPKGKCEHKLPFGFKVEWNQNDGLLRVIRPSDRKQDKALHGLTRSLIYNKLKGIAEGFSKTLSVQGVGYRAQVQGKTLNIHLGFSHPITYTIPNGIVIETPKPTIITVKGIDKALVGKVSAQIRAFFPPEPYKGKGIRYEGEYVRKKVGKAIV